MSFDTGDNDPKKQGALRVALEHLERMDFEYIKPIADINGTYAYKLRYQGGGLYLVARRAKPFKVDQVEYISTQKALINIAAETKIPILVAIFGDQDKNPSYTLFESQEIKTLYAKDLMDRGHDNMRKGVRMLNYEWTLGFELKDPRQIWIKLERIKLNRKEKNKYLEVNEDPQIFGEDRTEIKLQVTMDQELVKCHNCGALYTIKLPECPGCGFEQKP